MSAHKVLKPFFGDAFFEKEEPWINEMATKGANLVKPGTLFATFEDGEPGEWVYCIHVLANGARTRKGEEYLGFLRSTGLEVVWASGQVAYLRQPAAAGAIELMSDRSSQVSYLRRLMSWWAGEIAVVISTLVITIPLLLPAGQVTEKPVLDVLFLSALVAAAVGVGLVNAFRLARLASRVRALERERVLLE
ncbi:MAG: DUF2812 domain-containing protein [Coriobacteriia bacterium]|nr:DUF2812 domain-containing protein [Coriobacteriia bacterium]